MLNPGNKPASRPTIYNLWKGWQCMVTFLHRWVYSPLLYCTRALGIRQEVEQITAKVFY